MKKRPKTKSRGWRNFWIGVVILILLIAAVFVGRYTDFLAIAIGVLVGVLVSILANSLRN